MTAVAEPFIDDLEWFDVSRDKAAAPGIGGDGPHFCLGNQLAPLEL